MIGTDGGADYLGERRTRWIALKGIVHQTTAPYTPQQNGVAERYNRVLTERVMALLADSKLPAKWWAEAVVTANYLSNRVPHRGCDTTPYEAFHNARPDVSHLRVFGCKAWAYTPGDVRCKLQPLSKLGIIVGYGNNQSGYRILWDGKVTVCRDVNFDEACHSGEPAPASAAAPAPTPQPARFPFERGSQPDAAGPALAPTVASGASDRIADAVPATKRLVRVEATSVGSASPAAADGGEGDAESCTPCSSDDDSSGTPTGESSATTPEAATSLQSRYAARLLLCTPARRGTAGTAWALAAKEPHSPDKMSIHEERQEHDWELFYTAVKQEVDSLWANNTWYTRNLPVGKKVTATVVLFERKRGATGRWSATWGGWACGETLSHTPATTRRCGRPLRAMPPCAPSWRWRR